MPSYKITYFDARGFAEISRMLLTLKGQEFEDVRFSREEWPTIKPTTPYGQAPFLEVDGVVIAQSQAMSNFLAREFGFYGSTSLEMAMVDTVLGFRMDIFNSLLKVYLEQDEAKKPELEKEMYEVKLPQYLGAYEKILKNNGTGYFVGNKIGYADLAAFDAVDKKFDEEKLNNLLKDYPLFAENRKKVANNDNIKAYLAKRKDTPT